MVKATTDVRDRFERQRRNLLAINIVLVAYISLELRIQTLNIFGNTFDIGHPQGLQLWLWVFALYFFIRYYQYFMVIDNHEFRKLYDLALNKYAIDAAQRKYKKHSMQNLIQENPDGNNFRCAFIGDQLIYQRSIQYCEIEVNGTVTWNKENGAASQIFKERMILSGNEMIIPRLRSFYTVYVNTPHMTEYLLPFYLSTSTVIYAALH